MIIDFCHSFKDYDEILSFYGIWDYTCPKCGAKHRLHRHARYPRYLLEWDNLTMTTYQIDILRLKCSSCESTHAILTSDMIPFSIYSVQTFLALIALCMDTEGSVLETEAKTEVSYQLLYRFLRIFNQYRKQLLLFLRHTRLWLGATPLMPRAILKLLLRHPPPWPGSGYFMVFLSPVFLTRQNTVTYPLVFGCRLPESPSPT